MNEPRCSKTRDEQIVRCRLYPTFQLKEQIMNWLVQFLNAFLTRLGLLKDDLDYHLIRASMAVIFLFFGYQKWFDYELIVFQIGLQYLTTMDHHMKESFYD
jgi:hypothetical protein